MARKLRLDVIIADIEKVANILANEFGVYHVSIPQYTVHGRFCPRAFIDRFGSWNNALRFVGLPLYDRQKKLVHKRHVRLTLRKEVLVRDGFKCVWCGRSPGIHGIVLHIDHKIPLAKGGETTLDNLQVLCDLCNLGKKDFII